MYGEGVPAARMLEAACEAYGWSSPGLTDEMIKVVRRFQVVVQGDVHAESWLRSELAYLERNAELFRRRIR